MTPDELQQQIPEGYRTSLIWLPEKECWFASIDDNHMSDGVYVTLLSSVYSKTADEALTNLLEDFNNRKD